MLSVLVSLLNSKPESADVRSKGKPLLMAVPDQPMGLTVDVKGETDARRRFPPNFNRINVEDVEFRCSEAIVLHLVSAAAVAVEGLCGITGAAGNPCVAAHSTMRAPYGA
jgi:hypothetical protein